VRLTGATALREGHDYVLIGRRAALGTPFGELKRALGTALDRVHAGKRSGRGGTGGATTGADNGRPLHEAGAASRPRRQRDAKHRKEH